MQLSNETVYQVHTYWDANGIQRALSTDFETEEEAESLYKRLVGEKKWKLVQLVMVETTILSDSNRD